ncbi:octaprenyl diphosphate synthase [Psychrosphaera haliotis]|uniref:Octaprenyl diphosphate synthase n=1 Tax=Psychrosphaera haliotis TaxID=555083 RepID=A0A6N8FBP0_9GAMM|nr:octaprenyl diphosphate synthase [Psychrosphaera haliotis]MDB2372998.1 octaprenyl diphosphate synthase [Psychrosphaera haliotis]MUH72577.1 octaprenyl diphosphate synthase [Psychrosphaera haliotis]
MNIKNILELAENDMQEVNACIAAQLKSDVALINQLGMYIVNSGGKRIRPMLTVLAAQALGYKGDKHHTLAAIIEFIHTATLLHDDVVDESTLRRGKETANAVFGNQASVLVGDFLYTRSFQMMVTLDSMRVMNILADATNTISEGEVLQLMNCNDPDTTEKSYFDVIYGKTARLFEAATQLAAIISGANENIEKAMQLYGMHLGTAFQLIDDVMDYSSDADDMGKNVGDDLAEGKPTLPLLYAMWNGNEQQTALIKDAIENANGMDNFDAIMLALKETKAIEYVTEKAEIEADKAIEALSLIQDNPFKQALIGLAHTAVNRTA